VPTQWANFSTLESAGRNQSFASTMRNRFAFRFYALCACALRGLSNLTDRGATAATRKTARLNLAIINERRG
jgi:hypothetical protein